MQNMLFGESSLFLTSHAGDPIHWQTWGKAAFQLAKEENKPLFLSIGYSESHWCQVMARESFSHPEVASLLNENYIPVLVDRDLHPEVESVCMRVCSLLNGSAGWPLNLITTADGEAFFASSYLSRENSGNRIGLLSLLSAVAEKWKNQRSELKKAASEITAALNKLRPSAGVPADMSFVTAAASQLSESYDDEYGGFGKGAKFPAPQNLLFLIRYAHLTGDRHSREIVDKTLQQMYRGGIYDHFGGGFCRSSVDREWLKPNYEKLLADNAFLAYTYTEAWQNGKYTLYRTIAESTLDYCLRELKTDGGYVSGQDSDSDGMEGVYYLFTPAEVRKVLGEDDGRHFCECYDITEEGNFKGSNIPNLLLNNRWRLVPEGYDDFREKLRMFRDERITLRKSRTILTSANALLLMAFAKAAAVYDDPRYLAEAEELAEVMVSHLLSADGSVSHSSISGQRIGSGTLEDHVFFALGLLELYHACYDASLLETACTICSRVLDTFVSARGGFFDSSVEEFLPVRAQSLYDSAYPSGNSALVVLLEQLARITGNSRYTESFLRQAEFISTRCAQYPAGCAFASCAVLEHLSGSKTLLCVNPSDQVPDLLSAVTSRYSPEMTVLLKTPAGAAALASAAPWTSECSCSAVPRFYLCADGKTPVTI